MVADLFHFRPDPAPDPADQNFKNWLRVPDPTGLTKNQFKNLIFFHINLSSSDIWMMITPDPTKKVWIGTEPCLASDLQCGTVRHNDADPC